MTYSYFIKIYWLFHVISLVGVIFIMLIQQYNVKLILMPFERLSKWFRYHGFIQQNVITIINSNTKILFLREVPTNSREDYKLLLLPMAATLREACHVVKSQKRRLWLIRQRHLYVFCPHEVETEYRFQARISLVCWVSHWSLTEVKTISMGFILVSF